MKRVLGSVLAAAVLLSGCGGGSGGEAGESVLPVDQNGSVDQNATDDNTTETGGELSAFDQQYLITYPDAGPGEVLWENRGVLASHPLSTDAQGNLYVSMYSAILGNAYDRGTISVDADGHFRWANDDLTLFGGSRVAAGTLYSGYQLIDAADGAVMKTLQQPVAVVLEDGRYLTGSEQTTMTGHGTSTLHEVNGSDVWQADFGVPKAAFDGMVLTSEATLSLADGTKVSTVGLNRPYTSDIDHRLYGTTVYDGDSDRITAWDPATGSARTVMQNITETYDYIVADRQNLLLFYLPQSDTLIGLDLNTSAERWRTTLHTGTVFHEAVSLSPDQTRLYMTTSTAELISIDLTDGSEVWRSADICSGVIGFDPNHGTIYCASRYVTSAGGAADSYLVAVQP